MSGNIRRLMLGAALALPPVLATCKSSEAPKVATSIVITPSPVSFATVGRTQQLTAAVKDQNGATMTGQTVTWTGGGAAASVSATGLVTALANGSTTVTATSGSASQGVTVTVAQAGALIAKVSGDAQTATVGQALAQPLVVSVADSASHPAAGVTVAFAIGSGGGSVGTALATTNATGAAQSTWTLGTTAGTQSVTATVTGASGSPLTFTATASAGGAKSVAIQAGNNQTAATGTAVPVAPAVIVKDTFNNGKAGVTVTFSTTAGNGSVTGAVQTTNSSGIATVGSWTLGNVGTDTLTATVTGTGITGNPVKFTATSVAPGPAANVAAYVGNNKPGLVGWAVNVRPAVRVTDNANLPVGGATVTFAVTGGGGSGTGLVASTNINGIAQVGSWVLGGSPAVNTMTATVTGASFAGNLVTFADTGYTAGYTITIQNYGPTGFSAEVQSALDSAVAKWRRLIYRPVGTGLINVAANTCGSGTPALNKTVTDLLILAKFDSIDGPGHILGQAYPCLLWNSNNLTAVGVMFFDSADAASMATNGVLGTVMLHEMGHVIGLGTLWLNPPNNLVQDTSHAPSLILDTYYNGAKGRAAFDSLGGLTYTGASLSPPGGNKVPVENCGASSPSPCGVGTENGHWREPVFGNELMTGYVNSPGANPLSFMSVAAQEDLGYVVNYAAADAYVHAFTAPVAGGAALLFLGGDIGRWPMYVVDTRGNIVRVIPAR